MGSKQRKRQQARKAAEADEVRNKNRATVGFTGDDEPPSSQPTTSRFSANASLQHGPTIPFQPTLSSQSTPPPLPATTSQQNCQSPPADAQVTPQNAGAITSLQHNGSSLPSRPAASTHQSPNSSDLIQPSTAPCPFTSLLSSAKPPEGKEGSEILIRTNHFSANLHGVRFIYRYDVEVVAVCKVSRGDGTTTIPSNTPRKTRRLLLQLLRLSEFEKAATDYAQHLVSLTEVTGSKSLSRDFIVDLLDEGQTHREPGATTHNWKVTLTPTDENYRLDVQTLVGFLNGSTRCQQHAEIVNSLNLMVSRRPLQGTTATLVGKDSLFLKTPHRTVNLRQGLEAKPGYSRSVRALLGGPFLQINSSASAFYRSIPLNRLIEEWNDLSPGDPQDRSLQALEKFIRGLQVRTKYGTPRTYSVWGLSRATVPAARPSAENVRFLQSNDRAHPRQISVREHFREKYQEDTPADALVINVGSATHPVSVPCNLLDVIVGNAYRRLLTPSQASEMITFAGRTAIQNQADIEGAGIRMFGVNVDSDSLFDRFNIKVDAHMLQISARRLQSPTLQYCQTSNSVGKSLTGYCFRAPQNGSWLLNDKLFPKVGYAPKCAWVELHEGKPAVRYQLNRWISDVKGGLAKYCSRDGMVATLDPLQGPGNASSQPFPSNMPRLKTMFEQAKRKGFDIVFVVLQSKNARNYDNLKYVADVKVGIHTICTVQTPKWEPGLKDRFFRPIPQIKNDRGFVANEMLKVNLKMGGVNTSLIANGIENSEVRKLLSSETMIIGADVTHPGPGSMKGTNSIAAVVGSIEETFSQYPASFHCQESKKEMISNLKVMLTERLEAWSVHNSPAGTATKTGVLPKQILFFRDGVAENQFQTICDEELPLIKEAFKIVYGNRKLDHPKLLFVCIVKRVNTRFFPKYEARETIKDNKHPLVDRDGNSWPGLIVDTQITYPRGYDFYMQSQRALKGTAKPAHYVVIVDEIGVSPNSLQKAIFWQCWTYQRSLTPISIHPAARAADRACNRARSYLREFLVGCDEDVEMNRDAGGNAESAWDGRVHQDLKDSTFYL